MAVRNFLDKEGLELYDELIKHEIDAVKASNFTAADREKFDGISEEANKVSYTQTLPSGTKIGELSIDGDSPINLYAPTPPSESDIAGMGFTKNTGTITGITMNGASKGSSGVVDLGTVITDVSGKQNSSTAVKYGGSAAVGSATKGVYVDAAGNATAMTYELNKTVPADAKFTDTTYEVLEADKTDETSGSLVTPLEKYDWNGKLDTVSGGTGVNITVGAWDGERIVKANLKSMTASTLEAASKGSTANREYAVGVDIDGHLSVNIPWTDNNTEYTAATAAPGNVASSSAVGTSTNYARQDHTHGIAVGTGDSNGQVKVAGINASVKGLGSAAYTNSSAYIAASAKGAASGVAELDSSGKVPSSQLPAFVDDVLEYTAKASFPATGETGKIYVDTTTNLTYRWSGTAYVEISPSLALGETSSTAYRGDRGKTAYNHASAKGSAFSSGLYKITTNAEGHVTAASAVTKSDITGLGIPASNTNTTYTLTQDATDGHKFTFAGSDGTSVTITIPDNNTTYTLSSLGIGNVKNYDQSKAIKSITRSGTTFTYTCLDNTTGTFTQQDNNTWTAMVGATSSANGTAGYVPAPPKDGYNTKYLRADGTWAVPSYPTVNNATLTIQKNGTNVQTFTANQSTNATANITVPTKVSELTNDSGFTTNAGTITGIKMNGASKGTSGVVDLGTVLTAHQDISGKADKSATVSTVAWDGTNKKITKTINGTTSDVVTAATILGNLTKAQVTTALGYTPPTSDTNTHRPIQVNGTEILGNNTTALNLKAGSNVSVTNSSGTVTIAATDTNTWRGIQDNLTSDSTTESLSAKQGKNLANGSARDSTKLPLSGGQLTNVLTLYREGTTANNHPAQLKFKVKDTTTGQTYSGYIAAYQDHSSTTCGTNMVVQSGGGMFLGSGESPAAHYAAKGASYSGEDTFITADGTLHLQSNGNTIANRKGFIVSTTGNLIPETADTTGNGIGGIGSSTNRIKDVYTWSFNELITGSGTDAQDKGSSVSPRYFPAKWTFNIGRAPVDGDIITIKIPCSGHDYGVFVSINNGTNYHPVRFDYGTGRLTTHFGNGQYITLVYTPNDTVNNVYAVAGANARSNIKGCWTVLNQYNTNTDVRPSAYCDTAAGTAAKVASCSGYNLLANSYIHVIIVNTNTYAGAITLNINSKGAKPIYINGAASSSSNYALTAGSYLVFYNGTNYYFRKDGKITTTGLVNTSNTAYKLTDEDVTQGAIGADAYYPILFSGGNQTSGSYTGHVGFDGGLLYNPETNVILKKDSSIDATKTNNNVSSNSWQNLYFVDKNDKVLGNISTAATPSGSIQTVINAKNYDTSGNTVSFGYIAINAYKDGTATYDISNPSAFRKAIGLKQFSISLSNSGWVYGTYYGGSGKVRIDSLGKYVNPQIYTMSSETHNNACRVYSAADGWVAATIESITFNVYEGFVIYITPPSGFPKFGGQQDSRWNAVLCDRLTFTATFTPY